MSTILIVDDRVVCRDYLTALLKFTSHRALEAENGKQALEIIKNEHVELVITDLLMPIMNGYELVQVMKSTPEYVNIPIIFNTASFLSDEGNLLADTCGVDHILFKPCEPQDFFDKLKQILPDHQFDENKSQNNLYENKSSSLILDKLSSHIADLDKFSSEFSPLIKRLSDKDIIDDSYLKTSVQFSSSFQKMSKITAKLIAIMELTIKMMAEKDKNNLLTIFAEKACEILNCKYCYISIINDAIKTPNDNAVNYIVSGINDKPSIHQGKPPHADAFAEIILNAEQPIIIGTDSNQNNVLGIKLSSSSYIFGYIYFLNKVDNTQFNEIDSQIACILAKTITLLYENVVMYDLVQKYATKLQVSITESKKLSS